MKNKTTIESYRANDMPSLQREAIITGDLDTLRMIKDYQAKVKHERFYYVREAETIIRDKEGNEIDPKSLPFPQNETSLHFYDIGIGAILFRTQDMPGDLMSSIKLVLGQTRAWLTKILEVPGKTEFPVPGGILWWANICMDYVKTTDYITPPWRSHYRLDGRPKSRIYRYEINGNRIISSQPPRDGSPYTTTIE